MAIKLLGIALSVLVLTGPRPAVAGGRDHRRIQCCLPRASGGTKCRLKTARACRTRGGVDLGRGGCRPSPCAPTTSTTMTPATTTTTMPGGTNPGHVQLLIRALATPVTCGGPGYDVPASEPFSGEVDDAVGTKLGDLELGCVYAGGAAAGRAGGGTPITSRSYVGGLLVVDGELGEGTEVALGASDDPGPLGCSRGAGPGRHCLGTVSAGSPCATDADCGGTPGTCQPDTHCYTTEPIDYANTGIAGFVVCLVNVVEQEVSGTIDIATGDASQTLPLATRVYLSPCPKCVDGRCGAGKNAGDACTTSEGGGTSVRCLPQDSAYFGVVETTFASTTGTTDLMSDAGGIFCSAQPYPGAFGLADARTIVQHGRPAGDLRDRAPHEYTRASTGCVPASSNTLINQFGGLPFPLAVATRATVELR